MEIIVMQLTLFVLALYLGVELINKVPPTLHTPLMSGSNAISGIAVVGALLVAGTEEPSTLVNVIACIAVIMGTTNVVGGYLVTNRMLTMFRKKN